MKGTGCAVARLMAQEDIMNTTKIIGTLLIVAGTLGLIYGGFSYTKETHTTQLGPLQLKIEEKETVLVPVIASVGALAIGLLLPERYASGPACCRKCSLRFISRYCASSISWSWRG